MWKFLDIENNIVSTKSFLNFQPNNSARFYAAKK